MIGFKGEKPFCDLQCMVCGAWVMKSCHFGERIHMRMLMAVCLGRGMLLDESQIIGLWKDNIMLDCRKLDVTPPTYDNWETEH